MILLQVRVILPAMVVASMFAQDQPKPPAIPDGSAAAPTAQPGPPAAPATASQPPGGNRVLGVLPNYRTADASQIGTVLTRREKLTIAAKDSFDYPLVLTAAAVAGLGQLSNQHPSFGQGLKGYGRRWATSYGDQAMGNMLTEGFFPVLLHEDPRYFRRGTGSVWSRLGYAVSRVMVTQKDAGGTGFNFSEWLGNATVVGIGNAYYPDGRNLGNNATRLVQQVGIDAASQVLKEFWPDIRRKVFHKGPN
jgi:hypothetical protein